MSVEPTAPTAADQATSDPEPLVPTDTPVTAREIAEFLRHLTDLRVNGRGADPALSTAPPASGRGTP